MRKLREDITVKEAWEWASNNYQETSIIDVARGIGRDDYPDSFYKTPEIGSFGKFWNCGNAASLKWGKIDNRCLGEPHPYHLAEIGWFDYFTPGLPTDVNADGSPK